MGEPADSGFGRREIRLVKRLLLIASLFLASAFAVAEDWSDIVFGPFAGLNTRESRIALPQGSFSVLTNFNVTAGGKSIKKREGTASAFSLTPSTSPVHNGYLFYTQNGDDVVLMFNERRFNASINGGAAAVIYSTATNAAVYDCADYLGYAYCVNSARDGLFVTSGTSVANVNTLNSTGTMVAALPTRLAMAGFPGSASSRIDFSGETDFTLWTLGNLGTSPTQITINAPGSRITHITYAFGRLIWFKESSFGYIIDGVQPAQEDWVIKTVSNNIGTLDNTSTVDPDGNLYFRGQDKRIYKYDGNAFAEFSNEIIGTVRMTTSTASEQAYSTFFDNKLLFSVAENVSGVNALVLVYDFVSQAWSTYRFKASDGQSVGPNGFWVRNNQLYFGSSLEGKVYRFGSVSSDDGYAITGTAFSKPMFLDSPFKTMDGVNVSALTNVTLSTYTVFFADNSKTVGNFTLNAGLSSTTTVNGFWYTNKNLPMTSPMRSVAFGLVETSTQTALEVYSIRVGVRPRSWRVEP